MFCDGRVAHLLYRAEGLWRQDVGLSVFSHGWLTAVMNMAWFPQKSGSQSDAHALISRLSPFIAAARQPSQVLSTYFNNRKFSIVSAQLCLQHVSRDAERRAVGLQAATPKAYDIQYTRGVQIDQRQKQNGKAPKVTNMQCFKNVHFYMF